MVPVKDAMEWAGSPLVQLLKVAWGFKFEPSNEYMSQVAEWFEMNAVRSEPGSAEDMKLNV